MRIYNSLHIKLRDTAVKVQGHHSKWLPPVRIILSVCLLLCVSLLSYHYIQHTALALRGVRKSAWHNFVMVIIQPQTTENKIFDSEKKLWLIYLYIVRTPVVCCLNNDDSDPWMIYPGILVLWGFLPNFEDDHVMAALFWPCNHN